MEIFAEGILVVMKKEENISRVKEMVKGLTDKYPLI